MIFLFVLVSVLTNVKLSSLSGSNLHLKEIFLGRCWDYRLQKTSKSLKNCTEIWSVFYGGFAYKDPCSLNFSDYEPYFTAVGGGDIVNKVNYISIYCIAEDTCACNIKVAKIYKGYHTQINNILASVMYII